MPNWFNISKHVSPAALAEGKAFACPLAPNTQNGKAQNELRL